MDSKITRWAIFLPMPWAQVRAFSSPVMMLSAKFAGIKQALKKMVKG